MVDLWKVLTHCLGPQRSFGHRALLLGSSSILVKCSIVFFEHFACWPNKIIRAHLVLTLPQPGNQPWFLLVILETKVWFIHDICDEVKVLSFSLKIYSGHRPNGSHNPKFEKHSSKVTHSLITVIFWKPRPRSRWSLSVSTAENLWQLVQASGTERGRFPGARAGLAPGNWRPWSCLGSRFPNRPTSLAFSLKYVCPCLSLLRGGGGSTLCAVSPYALLVGAAGSCDCDLFAQAEAPRASKGRGDAQRTPACTEPWDHTSLQNLIGMLNRAGIWGVTSSLV